MFSHWGSVNSPHEEQAITGLMSSTPRARVTTEMSGHRPKSDRRRSDARSGMNEAWEDAAEDDEDRPGRLLHQAVIYKNVELLQVGGMKLPRLHYTSLYFEIESFSQKSKVLPSLCTLYRRIFFKATRSKKLTHQTNGEGGKERRSHLIEPCL